MKILVTALLFLVSEGLSSKWPEKASLKNKLDCKNIKCPPNDDPVCVRISKKKKKDIFIIMVNECELQYMKCHQGIKANIVPMKNCGHEDLEKLENLIQKTVKGPGRKKRHTANNDYLRMSEDKKENAHKSKVNSGIILQSGGKNKNLVYRHNRLGNRTYMYRGQGIIFADYIMTGKRGNRHHIEKKYKPDKTKLHYSKMGQGVAPWPGKDFWSKTKKPDTPIDYWWEGITVDGSLIVPRTPKTKAEHLRPDSSDIKVEGVIFKAPEPEGWPPILNGPKRPNDRLIHLKEEHDPGFEESSSVGQAQYATTKSSISAAENVNDYNNDNLVNEDYEAACPTSCPMRNVMVCAECGHGIYKTFLSVCHLRMFHCKHPDDSVRLVSREPCAMSAPFLSEAEMDPNGGIVKAPTDKILKYIYDRDREQIPQQDGPVE